MAIKANFTYNAIPELSTKTLQALVREALRLALLDWKSDMEPKHFTVSGGKEYGYQPRKKGYQIQKARTKGTTAPLVLSGDTKRMALASNRITTRGNQVTLSIQVPEYIQFIRASKPDMVKELTTVTQAEQSQLAERMDAHLQRLINQLK